jgi:hypothetical protein
MIRHIVLFGLPEQDKQSSIRSLKAALEPLANAIPGVISLRVDADLHRVDGHWDLALVSEHETWEALDAYQVHPDHQEALQVVTALVDRKAVVDYEL